MEVLRILAKVVLPALQEGVIGFGLLGLSVRNTLFFALRELYREDRNDLARDPVLQSEHVGEQSVIAVCPNMPATSCVDQLNVDSQFVARTAYTALQHVAHTQFFGHLPGSHSLTLVGKG